MKIFLKSAIILSVSFLIFTFSAYAETIIASGTVSGMNWSLNDNGVLTVSGTGEMQSEDGYAPWAGYSDKITSAVISNGITNINYMSGCTNLQTITIPETVTSISYCAFKDCTGLTDISLPSGVTKISFSAFENCSSLKNITIPQNMTSIEKNTFKGCTSIAEIVIPDTVTSIGDYAFYGCTGIKNLTLGTKLEQVDKYSFENCTGIENLYWNAVNLCRHRDAVPYSKSPFVNIGTSTDGTNVIFGDTVKNIPAYAFAISSTRGQNLDKFKIKSITVGLNVAYVGKDAFININSLEKVLWNAKHCNVETYNFNSSGNGGKGIDFIFGDTAEYVPSYILYGFELSTSPNVKTITIGKNVTAVGSCAFGNLQRTITVYWNARNAEIGTGLFATYSSLLSLTIVFGPDVENIPVETPDNLGMLGNISVRKIVIESNITAIKANTFKNAKLLWHIYIPNSVKTIENGAFDCDELRNVYYCGTENEWNNVEIGKNNGSLKTAEIKFVPDRKICFSTDGNIFKQYNTAQENEVKIPFDVPKKFRYSFVGWAADEATTTVSYMPGDIIPSGTDDITLYAIWEKSAYTSTKKTTENGKDIFTVTAHGIPLNAKVIFITFKNGAIADVQYKTNTNEAMTFYTENDYSYAAVMSVDKFDSLIPFSCIEKIE